MKSMSKERRLMFIIGSIGVAFLLGFPFLTGPYYAHILIMVFINITLVLGYRLLFVTGLVSFCHITFHAIGGYASAILATKLGLPFGICFLAGGLLATVSAALLGWPAVKAKPIYFFIISFGFLGVVDSVLRHWESMTGGYVGIRAIPPIMGFESVTPYYYISLIFCALTIFIMYRLDRSRFGAELLAISDDDALAEASGINVVGHRVIAFAIGALFAGLSGSIHAHYFSYINPGSFSMWGTIYILIWCFVGGGRKLWGPIIATTALSVIEELIRASGALTALIYGGVLLAAIMTLPNGLVGLVDSLRERKAWRIRE